MTMYFLPGDRKRRRPTGGRLVFGGAFRGEAASSKLVPFEEPRKDGSAQRRKQAERQRDVAEAAIHVRNQEIARERFG